MWEEGSSAAACSNNGLQVITFPEALPRVNDDLVYHVGAWDLTRNANAVTVVKQSNGNFTGGGIVLKNAYDIDVKFDDGMPGTGKIFASQTGTNNGCVLPIDSGYKTQITNWFTSVTYPTMNYPHPYCQIHFWID
jgi:hypothetical protein